MEKIRRQGLLRVVVCLACISALVSAQVSMGEEGRETWVNYWSQSGVNARLETGLAVTMDDSAENIYAAGLCENAEQSDNALIIKYDGEGNQIWQDAYNHVGNGFDRAVALGLDTSSDLYVAIKGGGRNGGTSPYQVILRKYPANFQEGDAAAWSVSYQVDDRDQIPYDMAVAPSGDCYIAGENEGRGLILKYNSQGEKQWTVQQNFVLEESSGWFSAIEIDSAGNVYVTGQSQDETADWNFVTAKYTTDGDLVWIQYLSNAVDAELKAYDIALDPSGNVCCGGYFINDITDGVSTWCVVKYDNGGNELWSNLSFRGDNEMGNHYAKWLAVDSVGNIYLAGEIANIDSGSDIAVAKYDGENNTGDILWSKTFSGSSEGYETAAGVEVDANDNVYVCGVGEIVHEPALAVEDFVTMKYNSDGVLQTIYTYNNSDYPGMSETPNAMYVTPGGAVAVTGTGFQALGLDNMLTVLYAGGEPPVQEPPTRPVFIPVLHIDALQPSTAPGGGVVTYTYEWTSSNGESVIHSNKILAEDELRQGDSGITFDVGETWTVTVTPSVNDLQGETFVGEFTFTSETSVEWLVH